MSVDTEMDTDSPEDDDNDHEIRQLETLHQVAAGALQQQVKRFHTIERKVWRHTAVLGVILGGFAISAPQAVQTLQSASGLAARVFAGSYFLTLLVSWAGLLCFVMAMRYEILWTDPLPPDDEDKRAFVEDQATKDYCRMLVSLAGGAVESFIENDPPFRRKEFWAMWGWRTLPLSLVLVATALASFTALKL